MPRFVQLHSDFLDAIILFLGPLGLVGFVWLLVRGLARGWISGIAAVLIGAPVYVGILAGAITLAMRSI